MSKIFISYTSADKKWAEWIAWTAQEAEHTVHMHNWEIEGGGNIMKWMEDRHNNSDIILCVTSPTYLLPDKVYSAMERYAAMWADPLGEKGLLRFVVIQRVDLPRMANMYRRVHLHDLPKDAAKERLLEFLTPPKVPDKEPDFPGGPAAALPSSTEPTFPAKSPVLTTLIDTTNLPSTALRHLRGREEELRQIDEAWDNPKTHVLSVIAWGGMGKTALVTDWAQKLISDGGRGADAILAYSFYSQGTKERATSSDRFLDWAIQNLGIPDPGPGAQLKADAIAEALKKRRILLILDGIEPMQYGPGPLVGAFKDQGLRRLLRRAADRAADTRGGLLLVTSRLSVNDIDRWRETTAPVLNLKKLSPEASAQLLQDRSVVGPKKALRDAAIEFDGHPLALTLLAGFLVRRHKGDIRRRDRIGAMVTTPGQPMDELVHGHAKRVIESMNTEWISGDPLLAAIMRIVGLFDRPASRGCVEAFKSARHISGLDAYTRASSEQIDDALYDLRETGLMLPADTDAPDAWDAHPLIREWFGSHFQGEDQISWKAAHSRLYEHLRDATQEGNKPSMLLMEPLFQAITHGCRSGRHIEALNAIYKDRICKRNLSGELQYYAQRRLGAYNACLSSSAWFFERPFEVPDKSLSSVDASWILSESAFNLSSLGYLESSLPAFRSVLFDEEKHHAWQNASRSAVNLSLAELGIGEINFSINTANHGIQYAIKGIFASFVIDALTTSAFALKMAGRLSDAQSAFDRARGIQYLNYPTLPLLYGMAGNQYCEFLLYQSRFDDVLQHASKTSLLAERSEAIVNFGLDQCNIARAELGLALSEKDHTAALQTVRAALTRARAAVDNLHISIVAQYIPICLLGRARVQRALGDWDSARVDLDEAEEIAEPGPMRLYQCDAAIERCRIALARIEGFAPLAETPPVRPHADEIAVLKKTALEQWDYAANMIARCGYHKRDAERDELKEVLDGKRTFASLPPRV